VYLDWTGAAPRSDYFQRSDSASSLAAAVFKPRSRHGTVNWTGFPDGVWGITGGRGYNSSSGANHAMTFEASNANIDVAMNFQFNGTNFGFNLRRSNQNDHWRVYLSTTDNRVKAVKVSSSATTTVATGATVIAAGTTYTLRTVVNGDAWTVYLDAGAVDLEDLDAQHPHEPRYVVWFRHVVAGQLVRRQERAGVGRRSHRDGMVGT
jgi:hypothetical protein